MPTQDPLFLPALESRSLPGERGDRFRAIQAEGRPIPQIYYLFGFKPEATKHLAAFTEGVMRGPSPLDSGLRELIAAYTSRLNRCLY